MNQPDEDDYDDDVYFITEPHWSRLKQIREEFRQAPPQDLSDSRLAEIGAIMEAATKTSRTIDDCPPEQQELVQELLGQIDSIGRTRQ